MAFQYQEPHRTYEPGDRLVVKVSSAEARALRGLKARLWRLPLQPRAARTPGGAICVIINTSPRPVRVTATRLDLGALPSAGEWGISFYQGEWPGGEVTLSKDSLQFFFGRGYHFVVSPPEKGVSSAAWEMVREKFGNWFGLDRAAAVTSRTSATVHTVRASTSVPQREVISRDCVRLRGNQEGVLVAENCGGCGSEAGSGLAGNRLGRWLASVFG